jgi:guanine deaminase
LMQRVSIEGFGLTAAHLLYLATRAGAEALQMHDAGDLTVGRSADFVRIKPREGSVLASVTCHAESAGHALAALFTLAGAENIAGTFVRGRAVYEEAA